MRKTIVIAALCSFLLCMTAGYSFALRKEEAVKMAAERESKEVLETRNEINAETELIYQYFYMADRVTKEQKELAPDFLQGLNREQLQSIYNGWQMVLFSPEKVILRCKIEGKSSETYLLGEQDGYLAIFYEDGAKGLHLKEKTEVPLSSLPDGEARQIREGLRVTGEENLAKLLADLTS